MAKTRPTKPVSELPEYKKPPVVEVVCGVTFEPLRRFLVHHVGFLWRKFSDEFPAVNEQATLPTVIEGYDGRPSINLQPIQAEPWPRAFFAQQDNGDVIQVQRERFLYNWRKRKNEPYPRFETVYERFVDALTVFSEFADEAKLGDIVPVQFEVTYVNQLNQGEGWTNWTDVGRMFSDAPALKDDDRLLRNAEGVNWVSTFVLPEKTGRLYVVLRSMLRAPDQKPMLSLEMTVRGMPKDKDEKGMDAWFREARKWIVRGFYEITSERMQREVWKRVRP